MKKSGPTLRQIQKRVFRSITEPLTLSEGMRTRGGDGRSLKKEADLLIKPNDRLSSFERLEIYNRQYWFRILGCFYEDYPGLRAVLGEASFERLSHAYLRECPSRSFTLRNLGKKLEPWLLRNPRYAGRRKDLTLDMARMEWAHTEAFDEAELPPLSEEDLARMQKEGRDLCFELQPFVRLLKVEHPVDDLLIALKNGDGSASVASNAVNGKRSLSKRRGPALKQILPQTLFLAVHRHDFSVYYKRMEPEAWRLLAALDRGSSLSSALSPAFRGSPIPVSERPARVRDWFRNWSALHWFVKPSNRKKKV